MAQVPFPVDDASVERNLEWLANKLANLEVEDTGEWNGEPPSGSSPPGTPTNLDAVSSVEHSGQDSFIATVFSWDAVADAAYYYFKLTKVGESETYSQLVQGTTLRLSGLLAATDYTFTVAAIDVYGQSGSFATPFPFTTPDDTTPPPQVTGLAVVRGVRSLIASWDAITVRDLRDYQIQIATDAGFAGVVHDEVTFSTFSQWQPSTAPSSLTTYHVRVRAFDQTGNQGDWSTTVTQTLGPSGTAGVDYIMAGGVTADEITVGTLKAVVTLSGKFLTAASGQRMEMDNLGLRAYNSSGVVLANLKTSGTPVFQLRTSDTGDRVEFDNTAAIRMVRGSDGRDAWTLDTAGMNIYTRAGATHNWHGIDFWRDNMGDAKAMGELLAAWTSGSSHDIKMQMRDYGNNAQSNVSMIFLTSSDVHRGSVRVWRDNTQMSHLNTSGVTETYVELDSSRVLLQTESSTFIQAWLKVYKSVQSDGNRVEIQPEVQGDGAILRLLGPGMQYDNGFTYSTGSISAGGFASTSITYGANFHSNATIPYVIGSFINGSSERGNFRTQSHSRTGCSIFVANMTTSTESYVVAAIPIIT